MEALTAATASSGGAVRTLEHKASTADGTYSVTATFSIVRAEGREYRYFDGTLVTRTRR
jgi:hypothetical protein